MKERVADKLSRGGAVVLDPGEAAHFTEALREAVAVALEMTPEEVGDAQRLDEDLGLDSIDLFDVLDQMGETYGIHVALEGLPQDWLRGGAGATFRDFAEGLIAYLAEGPRTPEPGRGEADASETGDG